VAEKYASDYPLVGGVEQYFDTLMVFLAHVGEKPVEHDALVQWVIESFPGAKGKTAVGLYVSHISRMGFWAVKDGVVRITTEGSKLIEQADSDPEGARRTVLDNRLRAVAGYDAILYFLAADSRTLDEVDSKIKEAIGVEWKSKNQTTFRLNWLRSLGYAEKVGRKYQLTEKGKALSKELPQQKLPKPEPKTGKQPTQKEPPSVMVQKADALADQLDAAAVKGLDGADLEKITAEAFAFLGFETQVISGPGNPDVVLTAPMGDASYRALIDTKSRSSGIVQQNDVNFNALNEHKAKVNVEYVMVLGTDFSAGNLEKWSQDHKVRLLRIEELRQLLTAHAEAVIALDRLEDLFAGGGSTDEAVLSEILADSEHTVQAMTIARLVYDAVRSHQNQEGSLNAHSLYYILGGEYSVPAIEATVGLLQSDLVAALGMADNGSLYTRLTPQTLDERLGQLKRIVGGKQTRG
jgi:hypothetical protein